MSHSQFRNIQLILRHAWLNFQVKHMLLAGSTRLLPSFRGAKPIEGDVRCIIRKVRHQRPEGASGASPVQLAIN